MQKDAQSISEREREVAILLSSNPRLTLMQIARQSGADRRKIQRAIREKYRCGFKRLKNAVRLKRVQTLLTEKRQKYSVKEIAAEIGVTPNALSRFVKTMTGHCPTELRCLK
jgi:transcriptional regulator GlxA family with amidase domain